MFFISNRTCRSSYQIHVLQLLLDLPQPRHVVCVRSPCAHRVYCEYSDDAAMFVRVCIHVLHHSGLPHDIRARMHSTRRTRLHARATRIRRSASSNRRLLSRRNFDASRPSRHRHLSSSAFSQTNRHLVAQVSRRSSSFAPSWATRTRTSPAKPLG